MFKLLNNDVSLYNRWDEKIEIDSKFDILYKQQDKEFKLI